MGGSLKKKGEKSKPQDIVDFSVISVTVLLNELFWKQLWNTHIELFVSKVLWVTGTASLFQNS